MTCTYILCVFNPPPHDQLPPLPGYSPCVSVLIVLLPKADGGRRPIGLFATIIRVWMRSRVIIARKWEESTEQSWTFGGKGKGAQRAA